MTCDSDFGMLLAAWLLVGTIAGMVGLMLWPKAGQADAEADDSGRLSEL
jgi:hypothetical protein